MRNSEGYYDPTAGIAMKNVEQEERRKRLMSFKRGDIHYIESGFGPAGDQRTGRPAVIVSSDKNNATGTSVEVVYLTVNPKEDLPTHVLIRSLNRESTAICEQITTVAVERVGDYKGRVTNTEMANIEIAMLVSLDLRMGEVKEKVVEVVKEVHAPAPVSDMDQDTVAELAAAKAKCEMLQAMYESLLSKVMEVRR